MGGKNRNQSLESPFPKTGIIYVDTCGIEHLIGSSKDNRTEGTQVTRLKTLNRLFKERGHITSVPLIYEEIERNRDYYKRLAKTLSKKRKRSREGPSGYQEYGKCERRTIPKSEGWRRGDTRPKEILELVRDIGYIG